MVPRPVEDEGRVEAFPRWLAVNGTDVEEKPEEGAGDSVPAGTAAWDEEYLVSYMTNWAPECSPSTSLSCQSLSADDLFTRYSPLHGISCSSPWSEPTLFALNLYNSQAVLPTLSRTILALAAFLDPSTAHVSIFENGSTDETPTALAHLTAALSALGASHTTVSDSRPTDWSRLDLQKADTACEMAWKESKGMGGKWSKSVKFYDNWVSRSVTGKMFRFKFDTLSEWRNGVAGFFDQPGEEYARKRFRAGVPVPVWDADGACHLDSCWNGMLTLAAEPLLTISVAARYRPDAIPDAVSTEETWKRPRPVKAKESARFRGALREEGECTASECKTVARDFWSRAFDRRVIVPTVRVTYDLATYSHPQLVSLAALNSPSSSSLSLSPWLPPRVLCFGWARGWHIDMHEWRATWERPFATIRGRR
ncbi:hypothetical protein JCM11641_003840 [Rhodosporidiobolus odoratus]